MKEPNERPIPFNVPNIPNCLSFILNLFFIAFDDKDNIPDDALIASSTLVIIKKSTNLYERDNVITSDFSFDFFSF